MRRGNILRKNAENTFQADMENIDESTVDDTTSIAENKIDTTSDQNDNRKEDE